jgi:hypothetical protein
MQLCGPWDRFSGLISGRATVRPQRPAFLLLVFLFPCCALAQNGVAIGANSFSAGGSETGDPSRHSEIVYEGLASYGHYVVFGAAENEKLYTAGVEYDHPILPHFPGPQVDYAAELLPLVLLSQPPKADIWGNPLTRQRELVPGIGISPIGFRLLWRDGRRVMPYFEVKATVLGFTKKALSPDATYENWSFNATGGLKVKLNGRYDLRLGLLSDLHFSNAFVVRSNPAVDFMNASLGLVYRLGPKQPH